MHKCSMCRCYCGLFGNWKNFSVSICLSNSKKQKKKLDPCEKCLAVFSDSYGKPSNCLVVNVKLLVSSLTFLLINEKKGTRLAIDVGKSFTVPANNRTYFFIDVIDTREWFWIRKQIILLRRRRSTTIRSRILKWRWNRQVKIPDSSFVNTIQ